MSIDVITDYAFADCYNFLERDDIGKEFFEMFQKRGPAIWIFVQWPGIQALAMSLPKWLMSALSPPIAQTIKLVEVCSPIPKILESHADGQVALSETMPICKRRHGFGQTLGYVSTLDLPRTS